MSTQKTIPVTVIVPVYNAEKTLDRCLASLARQTARLEQILVINDGSTDKSWDIIRKWEDSADNITAVNHEDIGQARTMNGGIWLTDSDYVAEMDSDDCAELTMYEHLYDLAKDADADVVRCGIIDHWEDHDALNPQAPMWEAMEDMVFCPREEKDCLWQLLFGRQNCIPAGIYKREFLLNNQLIYRPNHNFEDTSLEFKIRASADRYVISPRCLYRYTKDNPQSGSATIKDPYAIREQVAEILRYCTEKHLLMDGWVNAYRHYLYMWAAGTIRDEEELKGFLQVCRYDYRYHPADEKYFVTDEDRKRYREIKG